MAVAAFLHLRAEGGLVETLALLEEKGVREQERRRRQAVECGGEGRQYHLELTARELIQGGEPLGHEVRVRREGVVGQGLPVRKQADGKFRREPAYFLEKPLRIPGVGREHRQGLAVSRRLGEIPGIAGAGKRGGAPAGRVWGRGKGNSWRRTTCEARIIPVAGRTAESSCAGHHHLCQFVGA